MTASTATDRLGIAANEQKKIVSGYCSFTTVVGGTAYNIMQNNFNPSNIEWKDGNKETKISEAIKKDAISFHPHHQAIVLELKNFHQRITIV